MNSEILRLVKWRASSFQAVFSRGAHVPTRSSTTYSPIRTEMIGKVQKPTSRKRKTTAGFTTVEARPCAKAFGVRKPELSLLFRLTLDGTAGSSSESRDTVISPEYSHVRAARKLEQMEIRIKPGLGSSFRLLTLENSGIATYEFSSFQSLTTSRQVPKTLLSRAGVVRCRLMSWNVMPAKRGSADKLNK